MTRTDYSKDVTPLLDYEVDDYDTISFRESGEHPTGINDDRMRLPTRYDISKFYKRNIRNPERGKWRKREDELVNFSDDFDWQITYSFPSTLRNPKTPTGSYGGKKVTYRRLYLILCEHFNEGRFFIDDYFESVYPRTMKPEVDRALDLTKKYLIDVASEDLVGAVATKSGKLNLRASVQNRGMKAKLKRYEDFAKEWEDIEGEYLARRIKEDIISCLMSGQIPLAYGNEESTKKARVSAGLGKDPKFYATAQLIEHIQLFVKIRGNRTWRTSQGIMV